MNAKTHDGLGLGCSGKNIAADLHMEHLNRQAKDFLGSNITNEAVQRIGRSLRQTLMKAMA